MNHIIKGIAVKLSKRAGIQKLLEKNVKYAQWLMGIGAAGDPRYSGESAVLEYLCKNYRQPFTIFDCGANTGQFLQVCLDRLRKYEIDIHCFEPGSIAFEQLFKRYSADERVTINRTAISDCRGEATLYYERDHLGLACLVRRRLDHFNIGLDQQEKIRTATIDQYCEEQSIKHISLLKLDIEGWELAALNGAKRMLQNTDLISFEFGGCNIDTRTFFQDYWYQLEGWTFYRITPSGYLHMIEHYNELYEQFRTTNFMAKRKTEK